MNESSHSPNNQVSQVIDLAQFKQKKEMESQLARGRRPLYVDSKEGRVSGQTQADKADFSDRLSKIRGSLDRINQLMTEIKKLSANQNAQN